MAKSMVSNDLRNAQVGDAIAVYRRHGEQVSVTTVVKITERAGLTNKVWTADGREWHARSGYIWGSVRDMFHYHWAKVILDRPAFDFEIDRLAAISAGKHRVEKIEALVATRGFVTHYLIEEEQRAMRELLRRGEERRAVAIITGFAQTLGGMMSRPLWQQA